MANRKPTDPKQLAPFVPCPRQAIEAIDVAGPLWPLYGVLMKRARFTDDTVQVRSGRGLVPLSLKRGQCICGSRELGQILRRSFRTINDQLKQLEALGVLQLTPNSTRTIVTLNWYGELHTQAHTNCTPKTDLIAHPKQNNSQRFDGDSHSTNAQDCTPKTDLIAHKLHTQAHLTKKNQIEEGSSSTSKLLSLDANLSLLVKQMAALVQAKTGKPISESGWLQLVQAAHVGRELAGTAAVVQWVETAREKSKLTPGYFVACAVRTAQADSEDFDAMKRDAPRIPFEPPPLLAKREPSRGLDFERERSRVIREARQRGETLSDAEADRRAKERIENNTPQSAKTAR